MNNDFFYSKDNQMGSQANSQIVKERLNLISNYMSKQLKEYNESTKNTNAVFCKMLKVIEEVVDMLKKNFEEKGINPNQITFSSDADKSIAILSILWHSISFTMRENIKPQALYRKENAPLFCGRIIALNGDFQKAALDITDLEYPDILNCEIASLYIPADKRTDAIMKIKHVGNIEYSISQQECAREFLLKVIEIICGGGFYHEESYPS